MFRSLFWRGFAVAITCLLLQVISLPSLMPLSTAFAQAASPSSVTVERVWTRDGNGQDKSNFVTGDAIQYTVLVRNTGNTAVTATFVLKTTGPRQIFSWNEDVPVPPGFSGYYSPSAIPNDAPPGTYTLQVTVTTQGHSSTKTSQFAVRSTRHR
ncbi:MAG TPA: hypothetical protein VF043_03545 [Ktedonobacteraceae bacterium]